ncbi:unnamed protein product [Notodromas monacha]|uniref:AAA+ ATPase domain-containing protein n=1 Tax=Notodromas monacha TaxID=399045 RepID=A0A7R9BUW3_9CRUS|nr:unnamed protein product [Notodromas monacha]CAG0922177.1 unnamed protein product [Notodromas monacha]
MRTEKEKIVDVCVYVDRPPLDCDEFERYVVNLVRCANISALVGKNIPSDLLRNDLFPDIGRITVESELNSINFSIDWDEVKFRTHVVVLRTDEPESDFLDDGVSNTEECVSCAEVWQLPHANYVDVWESLVFESTLKNDLFNFVEASLLFSKRGLPMRYLGNKLVFLHGPPGTGKTTLCHALAQKLSVYMSSTFENSYLVQVNSHSLFSRWFSESGKLVTRLFDRIKEMVENSKNLVVVLIDEIESLAMVRKASSEPSDSVRAVNALLTQLDSLKRHENVLILTTSNLTEAVDSAFCSRADIKRYVGLPSVRVMYEILRQSCFQLKQSKCVRFDASGEMEDKDFLRIFTPERGRKAELAEADAILESLLENAKLSNVCNSSRSPDRRNEIASEDASSKLKQIANLCVGLTPRTLEKLPLLVFSKHVVSHGKIEIDLFQYLEFLEQEVRAQFRELKELNSAVNGHPNDGFCHDGRDRFRIARRSQ